MDRSELFLQIIERTNLISEISDLEELLDAIMELFIDICQAQAGALYLLDQGDLIVRVSRGIEGGQNLNGKRISPDNLARELLHRQETILSNNGGTHLIGEPDHSRQELENALSVPLITHGDPIGIIQLFNVAIPDIPLIELLADRAACEIDKALIIAHDKKRIERLETLIGNFEQIVSNLDRDQLLHVIIDSASVLLDTESSSIFLIDQETGELILHMARNLTRPGQDELRVPPGKGIIGYVVQSGETVIANDIPQDKRHYTTIDNELGLVTHSILAVPLVTQQITLGSERGTLQRRIIGGLEAINKRSGNFTEEDAEVLRIFANQAGTILEITKLYSDANDLFIDAIKAFTTAIDAQDPYTKDHSQRVCDYSVAIAREMGLAGEMIHRIRISGLLHDIGKIAIPNSILTKPTRLTDEEYAVIKTHPEIGARIVSEIRLLQEESAALSQHHERLDGTGYPDGLADSQISLIGQIVATADVFDAMTSDRTYRNALPVEEVFNYMLGKAGIHFNLECVEAMISAHKKGFIKTEKESRES